MTLANGEYGKTYKIKSVVTEDEELDDFLFTLGCYEGEKITLISIISGNFVVSIKDGRYNIDKNLANVIEVVES